MPTLPVTHGVQLIDSGNPPAGISASNPLPVTLVSGSSSKATKTVTGSISANTAVVAAVPAKRIKVTVISWRTTYSAGSITPILTDGNGGATLWNDLLQAISGAISGSVVQKDEPAFICGTAAGNALYLNPNGQTVVYSISYFDDDAA
jgi:hypothetical protein